MSNIFTSSIGKKFWMALVGLFLCIFLVLHMSINLLLLLADRSYFDTGVYIMSTPPVKVLEIFLFGSIALHALLGLYLQIKNWCARGAVGYAKKYNSQTSFFSKYMIWTGGVIFVFLCIHLMQFYAYKHGWFGHDPAAYIQAAGLTTPAGIEPEHDFYNIARGLFACPCYCIIYIAFMALMSFHFVHAFQSAFQTIGWNHPTYTPIIKWIGYIYSVAVPVGFAVIPLYFLLGGK